MVQKTGFNIGNTEIEVILQGGFSEKGAGKVALTHFHPNFEVHYIEKGSFKFICTDTAETVSKGSLILIPSKLYHSFSSESDEVKRLSFEIKLTRTLSGTETFHHYSELFKSLSRPLVLFADIPELLSCSEQMGVLETEEDICRINALFTLSFLKICDILQNHTQTPKISTPSSSAKLKTESEDVIIINLLNYINNNFRTHITLSSLAAVLNLSTRQTQRLIAAKMSETFRSLLAKSRIEAAKELICSDATLSLEDISDRCGYQNYVSFYKQFKSIVGQNPAEYRKGLPLA